MALIRWDITGNNDRRIEGDGVFVRHPRPGDFEAWALLRGASRAFLTPWEPAWTEDELSRAAYRRRLRRYAEDIQAGRSAPFFVFRAEDDALVGGVTLSNIRRGVAQTASLGYWAGEAHARRGYTGAAVQTVLRYAFDFLNLHRVEAATLPENAPSRALLMKLGFQQEGLAREYLRINGVWRDHVLYGRLRLDRTA
jgi:[ribosomal protein S5]-alanine N-acetyltransferase